METAGDASPDPDGTQGPVDQWQRPEAQERCTTGKKAVWEGWGVGWGVHPLKDVTLTTTKRRAVSLTGDAPDTRYSKLWAARPRAFDHRGEGMGRVHRWAVASLNAVSWALPT